jgi:bacterioferritin (cytochrome b1)
VKAEIVESSARDAQKILQQLLVRIMELGKMPNSRELDELCLGADVVQKSE